MQGRAHRHLTSQVTLVASALNYFYLSPLYFSEFHNTISFFVFFLVVQSNFEKRLRCVSHFSAPFSLIIPPLLVCSPEQIMSL